MSHSYDRIEWSWPTSAMKYGQIYLVNFAPLLSPNLLTLNNKLCRKSCFPNFIFSTARNTSTNFSFLNGKNIPVSTF